MFKQYAGIDEAALGPLLGPYCCTAVSFGINGSTELFDLFEGFSALQIGDSKKLFTSGKSLSILEMTALAFVSLITEEIPLNLDGLLSTLMTEDMNLEGLRSVPWFKNLSELQIPVSCTRETLMEKSRILKEFMEKKSLTVRAIRSDVVPATRFNGLLSSGLNKSEVCQAILSPLLLETLAKETRLTVDRQGGRRYYGEWLIDLFPGQPLSINRETSDLSVYDIGGSSIRFQVKGDDKYLETALASIISKYLRELMMICFNSYWSELAPGIKKTAGYPQDARRFISDLKSLKLDFNESKLIRAK